MKKILLALVFPLISILLINKVAYSANIEKNKKGIYIEYNENYDEEIAIQYAVIDEIILEGNRITKPHIIHRELLFQSGDTISLGEFGNVLSSSRENLLNTSLFNFVEIDAKPNVLNKYVINISFIERWYLWPFPTLDIHERNVNTWLENPSLDRVSYGVYVVKDNFRGRMERIRFNLRMGYNERYAFSYRIPYLNHGQKLGISFSAGLTRTREVNYITFDNRQMFYKNPLKPVRTEIYAQSLLTFRKSFYNTHYLRFRYNYFDFADTLKYLNPNFFTGDATDVQFFSFKYEHISDHRDIKAYPLTGYFNKLSAVQQGFNVFDNDVSPVFSLENSYRRYWNLKNHWYFAAGLNVKASVGSRPDYFLQRGLGYNNNFVRGYEYYVVDGQHFAVLKTNLKYNVVPQRVKRLPFIPGDKFGLLHYAIFINIFADAGYINDRYFYHQNSYSNSFLAGSGIGIDFVTYYDKVFRTEFTYNRHGRFDVYFHLIAPI